MDGEETFRFFETAETGNRTPNSGVKVSGANHYPRAPALLWSKEASDRLIEQISILTFSTNRTQINIDFNMFKDMHRQSGGLWAFAIASAACLCERTVTVLKQVLSNYLSLRKDVTENQRQYKQYCFITFAELVALLKRT